MSYEFIYDFIRFFFLRLGEIVPGPLLAVASTLAGVYLGSVLSRRTSIIAVNMSSRNIAAAKLRAAFSPAQVQISRRGEIGNPELRKFFNDAFLIHAAAIEEFRPFASNAVTYQKAYEEYRKTLFEDDDTLSVNKRWESNIVIKNGIKNHQDFGGYISGKINNILMFANH